jgi:general secretion pathway protein D
LGKKATNKDGTTDIAGPGNSVSGKGNQSIQSDGAAVAKTGTYERAVNVFANNETGVLIVRATSRQHEKVQDFIDKVMATAKRQVLIEATIVEVRLNDNYKQGINWSLLQRGGTGFQLTQAATAGLPSANLANLFVLDYLNPTSRLGNLTASVSLLESFGNVKVLSSPKLSVMNNQTATLKVADNKVYFTITSNTTPCAPAPCTPITTYTTTPNSISVGFLMSVTPQISDSDTVTINVRPSITRITGYAIDPNPSLLAVQNRIPEIQTREMESIIKIDSGQIAVMGGLMQDEINNLTDAVPGVSDIPLAGELFKHRNDTSTKTELVIFLRPVVIKDASINGDFSAYRDMLPDQNFFKEPATGKP